MRILTQIPSGVTSMAIRCGAYLNPFLDSTEEGLIATLSTFILLQRVWRPLVLLQQNPRARPARRYSHLALYLGSSIADELCLQAFSDEIFEETLVLHLIACYNAR
jgi:hypothetical protein